MQVQGIFLLNNSKKTGGARAPCAPPFPWPLMWALCISTHLAQKGKKEPVTFLGKIKMPSR